MELEKYGIMDWQNEKPLEEMMPMPMSRIRHNFTGFFFAILFLNQF